LLPSTKPLTGRVEIEDAYLGGERSGGKRGRGAPGKMPFVAAVETTPEGKPVRLKLGRVASFCSASISSFAKRSLDPGLTLRVWPACTVVSDGLQCFGSVTDAGCTHQAIPRLCENPGPHLLPSGSELDSTGPMIRPGFLDSVSRQDLIDLARDGSAAHRLARRANALVLLDQGMSCEAIAAVLLLDDDTVRTWHRLYEEDGIEGLVSFGDEGSACRLSDEQQDRLKAWITEALPRTTREVGAWIEAECGIAYEGRSGLIALLHRLGMEHRKPKAVSRKLDPAKQADLDPTLWSFSCFRRRLLLCPKPTHPARRSSAGRLLT